MVEQLKTLNINNTGNKMQITVNGIELDLQALEKVNIHMSASVCEIETVYSKWYTTSRGRGKSACKS